MIGVAFLLIEQYPKESEEQDFTRRALAQMIKTGENSDDKMVIAPNCRLSALARLSI